MTIAARTAVLVAVQLNACKDTDQGPVTHLAGRGSREAAHVLGFAGRRYGNDVSEKRGPSPTPAEDQEANYRLKPASLEIATRIRPIAWQRKNVAREARLLVRL